MGQEHYPRKPFTKEQNEFLKTHALGKPYEQLAELFNQQFSTTYGRLAISKRCRRLGVTNGRTVPRPYTDEQIQFLREHADGMNYDELSDIFDEYFGTSTNANRIGDLCRRYGFTNGLDCRYTEGHITNLGRKFDHALPDGSEKIGVTDYVMIKHKGKWRTKHSVIWEEAHNKPIPEGHKIIFGDNNKRNFDISNLHCVSRSELAILITRKLKSDDPELAKAGVALAGLYATINKRRKERRR